MKNINSISNPMRSSSSMFGYALSWAIIAVLCIFTLRVIELQGVRGSEFRALSDENRLFTRYFPAPRGIFYDRFGTPLVHNRSVYKRATEHTRDTIYPTFEEIGEADVLRALESPDAKNLTLDQRREYPFGSALAPVLGYALEASAEELAAHSEYYLGQSVGKMGLEKVLQARLAGVQGTEVFETNASGKLLRTIAKRAPVAGLDVHLTIDASLSAKAYALLKGKRGAVVASDLRTGEILVLVSSPAFDPANVAPSLIDDRLPMLNRATAGAYPPGSTFKLMTALAALNSGVLDRDTKVLDEGELKVGEFRFGNWYFRQYGKTEGEVDMVKALQRSNDIYFYKAAEEVGPSALAQFTRRFHFGQLTGIEVGAEVAGVIPDPEWKQKTLGEKWFLGDTYHMGIGQGDVLVTPLQVNQATAAIANGGVWCAPHLLAETAPVCDDLGLRPEDLAVVVEGMKAACAPGGTAYPFFDGKPWPVACKTGTAEFGGKDAKGRRKTHALFTMMAPADKPTIVMTVLVESDEDVSFAEGSRDAAPVAKELIRRD